MGSGEPYPVVCQNMGPWNLDAQFSTTPNSHIPVQELPISCKTQSFPYYRAKYYVLYEKKKRHMAFATFLQQPLSQVPRKWSLGKGLQSIERLSRGVE